MLGVGILTGMKRVTTNEANKIATKKTRKKTGVFKGVLSVNLVRELFLDTICFVIVQFDFLEVDGFCDFIKEFSLILLPEIPGVLLLCGVEKAHEIQTIFFYKT